MNIEPSAVEMEWMCDDLGVAQEADGAVSNTSLMFSLWKRLQIAEKDNEYNRNMLRCIRQGAGNVQS